MKNYLTYRCSVCKRSKDFETDITRAFINQCTITQGCVGRLSPVGYKSVRNILQSAPEPGLNDWSSRFTNAGSTQPQVLPDVVSLYSGPSSVALAAKNIIADKIEVEFSVLKSNIQNFENFSFNIGTTTTIISGKDSSIPAKNLSFKNTDTISVSVNGQTLVEGAGVKSFTRISTNTLTFSEPLQLNDTVEVAVFSMVPLETIKLTFNKISGIQNKTNSWGNIEHFDLINDTYNIYVASDLSALKVNSTLKIFPGNTATAITNGISADIDIGSLNFLLSAFPFSSLENRARQLVPLLNFGTLKDLQIYYKIINGELQLNFDAAAIDNLLSIFSNINFVDAANELESSSTGVAIANAVPTHPLIIGPTR